MERKKKWHEIKKSKKFFNITLRVVHTLGIRLPPVDLLGVSGRIKI